MKALTLLSFLLLLNATSVFAQEVCEDEKNSIIELSKDVKKADQKLRMKNLMKWYNSRVETEEDEIPYIVNTKIVDLSAPDCSTTKTFFGISYITNADCKKGEESQRIVAPLRKGDKKSDNKFLAQVFSKKDGKITLVEEIPGMMSGKMFVVHKKLKNGNVIRYSINTAINPALNPVQVLDSGKKKMEFSHSMNKTFSIGASFGTNNGLGW